MMKFVLPLVLFMVLVIFLAVGLSRDPQEVPSPLIDKPAPSFVLQNLANPAESFDSQQMRGKVWVLNVWASWCATCQGEHVLITELARTGLAPIYGLNYKDERPNALAWLDALGDPYTLSLADTEGKVGLDFGVYKVPETFIMDRQGIVRYKQIGPITEEAMTKKIIPLLKELQK